MRDDQVDEQHEHREEVHAAGDAHEAREERVVDVEAREGQEEHAQQVDPVGDHEDQRMRLAVVSLCDIYAHPPVGFDITNVPRLPVLGSIT